MTTSNRGWNRIVLVLLVAVGVAAVVLATMSWSRTADAVDHEARRTFLNWVGCAVGAARHEAAQAALDAAAMLQPAPQARP